MLSSVRRFVRFAGFVALAAVALTGAARVGLRQFLTSSRGQEIVSERLGSAIGMPVEVSEINVGDDNSSFRFRVMDPADPKAEVLHVPSASADVSATDLMTGRVSPSALNLRGAALTLRVNERGEVLTPLPAMPGTGSVLPAVAIEGGRVSVKQEGRPDFSVSGVSVKVEPEGAVVAIAGTVNDPKWGEWTLRGELLRESRTGWVELTSAAAPLDAELLASLPFAPPGLFSDVKLTGRAAVAVRLDIGPNREVQPTVEIRPALSAFGMPFGPTYRLYANGTDSRFERAR
jgi:hypothetical protein